MFFNLAALGFLSALSSKLFLPPNINRFSFLVAMAVGNVAYASSLAAKSIYQDLESPDFSSHIFSVIFTTFLGIASSVYAQALLALGVLIGSLTYDIFARKRVRKCSVDHSEKRGTRFTAATLGFLVSVLGISFGFAANAVRLARENKFHIPFELNTEFTNVSEFEIIAYSSKTSSTFANKQVTHTIHGRCMLTQSGLDRLLKKFKWESETGSDLGGNPSSSEDGMVSTDFDASFERNRKYRTGEALLNLRERTLVFTAFYTKAR